MFLPSDIQSIPKEITSRTSTRTILVGILVNDDFRLRTWLQLVHVFGRITQEMTKLQEQLSNPNPVEETIPKKDLMSLLECPVCLDHFKPTLQVYKILFCPVLILYQHSSRYGNVQKAMLSVGVAKSGQSWRGAPSVASRSTETSQETGSLKNYRERCSQSRQERRKSKLMRG